MRVWGSLKNKSVILSEPLIKPGAAITMNTSYTEKKPNRLLQILICLSVGIHGAVFMYMAGLYQSNTMEYIELSLQDISKAFSRTLPRPVHRHKRIDQPDDFKKIQVNPKRIPWVKPAKIDSAESSVSKNIMEQISLPELPSGMDTGSSLHHIGEILDTTAEFISGKNYYEMVILKIETCKKYPESAKVMQKEGRVTIGFTLTLQGIVKGIRIIRSCQHPILDQAAIQAVKDAAPFPRPPSRYFKKEIPLELNIIFEIT